MDRIIGVLILSCMLILAECAAVEKEKSAEDTKQKRELNDISNNYASQHSQPHDQVAQEQNAQNQQHYQYTFQPEYIRQTNEENNEDGGVSHTKNLKKVYIIPNQSKTRYVTMAPQVQIAPVKEYNEELNQHQQQNNAYFNLIPQQRPQEQSQYNQELLYPHQNDQNQGFAQTVWDGNQKYQFIPYGYEHNHHQEQDLEQLQYVQQQKPLSHTNLLSYESIQQYNPAENSRVLEQYAPQYSNQQQIQIQEHEQQNDEIYSNKEELMEKINRANYEAKSQAEAYAKSQNDASHYQEQSKEPSELINNIHLEKLQAHAQAEAIAKSPAVVVHKEISILKRRPINIIKAVHVPVPSPVLVPVPQPYEQLIPQPYPVPIEIIRPVIIPIEKTEKIEIEKPVPVEVKKIVEVPVEKKIYYKVEKPVHVEKTVHVKVTKEIPVEVPIYKPQRLTILRHIWEH